MNDQRRCLYCYDTLDVDGDFHTKCCKAFFKTNTPPELSLSTEQIEEWASEVVKRMVAIPGGQPKLSLGLEQPSDESKARRLTVMGVLGDYILKPQSPNFPFLPENEHLTMVLARQSGIATAKNSLIRTSDGSIAYITKRFDRDGEKKIHMEDFCQLSELPSSGRNKYNGTMEKAGKLVLKYSVAPGYDMQAFFELAIFSFLTGNADMHLKNFSILRNEDNLYRLSPAYDLVSTAVALPDDQEQIALSINSKKTELTKADFITFASRVKIDQRIAERIISKQVSFMREKAPPVIESSFLPEALQSKYTSIVESRSQVLLN
jgi:serine/threonine-protein kinase HipA